MKRGQTIGLSLSIAILVLTLAVVAWWKIGGYYTVSVINIFNFQSRIQSYTENSGLNQGGYDGAAWLRAAIGAHKKKYPAAVITESGDLVMGPWWRFGGGEPEFTVAGLLGVKVGTLGNQEFNLGQGHLKKALTDYASFPVLATNISFEDQQLASLIKKTFILTTDDGVKVGFFSLASPQLVAITRAGDGLHFDPDVVKVANEAVDELLEQGAEAVVMLSHSSAADDLDFASKVDRVALIISGDSCSGDQPELTWVTGPGNWPTAVATCGGNGRNLPVFNLTLHRGRPVPDMSGVESLASSLDLTPDPEVAEVVAGFEGRMNSFLDHQIGSFTTSVNSLKNYIRTGSAPLGSFIADAFRQGSGARIAVVNAGDIWGDRIYPAGPVTDRTILEIMPFQNQILIKELTGLEVRRLLELSASALVGRDDEYDSAVRVAPAGFLHISGLAVTFSLSPADRPALVDASGHILAEGSRVKSVNIKDGKQWKTLRDEAVYTVAMPDFLGGGGDRYAFLADLPTINTLKLDSDLVMEHFKNYFKGKASLPLDERIKIEGRQYR